METATTGSAHAAHDVALPDACVTEPTTSDWSYVSEGGASIVFSYVGPPHPAFDGTVLRLRKSPRGGGGGGTPDHHQRTQQESSSAGREEEPDDPSIAFHDIVVSELVPRIHLPRLQSVRVSPRWLQALSSAAEMRRPVERRAKDGIDTCRSKGVLATDLVGGKGWAVEIKPKWGFLPDTAYLSPATSSLKARHCRFCMHAHLKNKRGDSSSTELYCPLDLYSGDETRVRRALTRLWEAWYSSNGKINNLRVFIGGEIIYPNDATSFNRLVALFPAADAQLQIVEALLPLLLETPLLSTLSRLQRTLDSLDIEGLSLLWSRYHPGVPLGKGALDPSLADWHEFVSRYKSTGVPVNREEALKYHIIGYLLSAAFKDCSIILRLGREGADGAGRMGNTITVIDLEQKGADRLAKWEKLDQEIVSSFAEVAAEREACIDAELISAV